MTNPFQTAVAPASPMDTPAAPPATVTSVPPAVTTTKAAEVPKNLGIGDPFAAPRGIGDGEKITDFVDRLLLVKPTEFISQMRTKQGPSDAVRADLAVLDDPVEPGKIIIGVLLFQQALRREAKAILDGPLPYLLGRLNKGVTGGGNDIYTFEEANDAEIEVARTWLKLGGTL
jgi:hypothetical protein